MMNKHDESRERLSCGSDVPVPELNKSSALISKTFILFCLYSYLVFLTFKHLVSIDIGFSIRIPHLIIGIMFLILFLSYLVSDFTLKLRGIYVLMIPFIVISLYNGSLLNPYLYYLFLIIFTNLAIFETLYRLNVPHEKIAKYLVTATIPHMLLSYLTLSQSWYGGYQLESYSDFSTFFAMQLSIIFPFIEYIKNMKARYLVAGLYIITILLLGARGALLGLIIGYCICYYNKIRIKQLVSVVIIGLLTLAANPSLIAFYASKLNPFSENYHSISDLNRFFYAVATIEYLPNWWVAFIGNGIKNNINVISAFFGNNVFSFTVLDDATVHNVFLELYSDYGIIVMLFVISFIIIVYRGISRYTEISSKPFLVSIIAFIVNYNLEANYAHYFFWFVLFFYYYAYMRLKKISFKRCACES